MSAIYKRELKSYAGNMSGAIAIAVMLFILGMTFWVYNIYYQVATYGMYSVSNAELLFYIVVPILTMRIFTEERKQKTDQILLTSPVSIGSIVMGKYLALITVFAIPVAVMCIFPLVVQSFGSTTLKLDYIVIIAFFIMGCAYLSMGMFISTLTESVIISAIVSILFVFMTQLMGNLTSLLSANNFGNLIFIVVLLALLGLLIYGMTKNYWISLGTSFVLIIGACVLYHFNAEWYSGKIGTILGVFDFKTHFANFTSGSFDLTALMYFISIIIIGIVLSIVSVKKRRWS